MKPQLGDTILNRYTLVSSLREEPGIQAWKANDRVLAKANSASCSSLPIAALSPQSISSLVASPPLALIV